MKLIPSILFCIFFVINGIAQDNKQATSITKFSSLYLMNQKAFVDDTDIHCFADTTHLNAKYPNYIFIGFKRIACKNLVYLYRDTFINSPFLLIANKLLEIQKPVKKPFLQVHGNIFYDLFYQSNIDTPYLDRDIYQQTIRAYLDVTVKDQYPVRVTFSTRFSNSNIVRDITGLGFQFNPLQFKNSVKNKLQEYVLQKLTNNKLLDSLKSALTNKLGEFNSLKNYLNSPDLVQQIIEAKEHQYIYDLHDRKDTLFSLNSKPDESLFSFEKLSETNKFPDRGDFATNSPLSFFKNFSDRLRKDSLNKKSTKKNNPDSILNKLEKSLAKNKMKYDSLKSEIDSLQKKYDKAFALYQKMREKVMANISNAGNTASILNELKEFEIPDTVLPKGYQKLAAIKSFGIGRTTVDYSELTAKNIAITGLQIEYNPSYYVALASGIIEYQFRDCIVNSNQPKQYLNIARIGRGLKEGNNIILSIFEGKKQLYNFYSSGNSNIINTPQPDYQLVGFTIESRQQFDLNNYIIAEFGKSSMPYFRRESEKDGLIQSALKFKDRSNEAYSLKLSSFLPATFTKINGMYKHTGADYQSFSYYNSSSIQDAWMLKIEQPFFKKKLYIVGSLRKNDFSSPYLNYSYQSNTIFKSIQATLRMKKWPIISVGYFPTSQLIKFNDDVYMENLFYTFTGTISHSYHFKGDQMNTMLTYIQFYNKQPDSNFVYYNTKNISFSHNIYFRVLNLQVSATDAISTDYNLYTVGSNVQFKIKQWLQVGGGLKYNNQTIVNEEQIGYNVNTSLVIPKIGTIQVFAEKGFIPGINRQLVKNNVGRLTFFKSF